MDDATAEKIAFNNSSFREANDGIEQALVTGRLSTRFPNIKRVAVQAMTQKEITSDTAAPEQIARFLRAKYTDPALAAELPAAITAVQDVFSKSIFPERKADWRVYPNNIGHKDWPGCFRCHDGKHQTADGKRMIKANDCNACHVILAQGSGLELEQLTPKGQEFKHPGEELEKGFLCNDCHSGGP